VGLSVLVLMLVLRRLKPGLQGCSPQDRSVHEVHEFTSISIPISVFTANIMSANGMHQDHATKCFHANVENQFKF
jgi:hypothetical protein